MPPQTGVSAPEAAANNATIQMTVLNDFREDSEHRQRCNQLANELDGAWINTNDSFLRNLLQSRRVSGAEIARPLDPHRTQSLVAFLQLTLWNMDARGAIAWLLASDWDFEHAITEYMNQRFNVDGAPGSELLVGPQDAESTSQTSEQQSDEPYVDEDPTNIGNVPGSLTLTTYYDSKTGQQHPAVRHESIRMYLIRQAAEKGQYTHSRAKGYVEEDRTSFLRAQRDWGFDKREQYPPISFVFERKDRSNPVYPGNEVPNMRWRGLLVLDHDDKPVRRFSNIPATLSTQAEGGLLEALSRGDSRIRGADLLARMLHRWEKPKIGGGFLSYSMVTNTLTQRATRFREVAAAIHWDGRSTNTVKAYDQYLLENLPGKLRDANNTRGLARNLYQSDLTKMMTSHEKHEPQYINWELVEEFPSGGERPRSAYHPAEEHDCRDCKPHDLAELASLNDAILITVENFMDEIHMCPRLPLTRMTYNELWAVIREQFVHECTRTEILPPPLRKIGRWTGGIQRWRSGRVYDATG